MDQCLAHSKYNIQVALIAQQSWVTVPNTAIFLEFSHFLFFKMIGTMAWHLCLQIETGPWERKRHHLFPVLKI